MERNKTNARGRGDSSNSGQVVGRNPDAPAPNRGDDGVSSEFMPDGVRDGNANYGSSTYNNPVPGTTSWSGNGHNGYFSDNNPYFTNLKYAGNDADMDALYERAVEWEADYANLQEQRDYNREVLEEQREYDSPLAQVQRQRLAGINPDLEGSGGSSSSGSSAQMQIPGMADQSGQSKFSNYYDNKQIEIAEEQNELAKVQTIFQGISAAGSFIGGLSGGISNIMNAVSNMKQVPSQIALNEANSALGGAKADEIWQLLHGKKEGQLIANEGANLKNIGTSISNATNTLSFLAEISNLIDPSADDETLMPYLNSLGVPEQNQPYFRDIIKQMHSHPEMRARYANANVKAKWSEAEDAQYTQQVVDEMTDLNYKIQYEQKYWNYNTATLKNKIADLLNTTSHAEQVASNEINAALLEGQSIKVANDELSLKAQQLSYDTEVFLQGILDRSKVLGDIDKSIDALYKQPRTPNRDAQINRLQAEKISLRNMLSSQFYQIKESYLTTSQQLYHNQTLLRPDNTIKDEGARSKYTFFSDATFNDLIKHDRTAGEIAQSWVNTSISAAGVVVEGAGVARGYNFNSVYKDAHQNKRI